MNFMIVNKEELFMFNLDEYMLHQVLAIVGIVFLIFFGCILNPGHGKIPAPDFNFYIQKDKYPI